MVNCGSVYYFINDFNDICRQKTGVKKDFSEHIELYELIDDINEFVSAWGELVEEIKELSKENKLLYDENIQLRNKLLHFYQLKEDIRYLEEKGVF